MQKIFSQNVSSLPLSVFRIAFVAVLLTAMLQNFYFRHLIFDWVSLEPQIYPIFTSLLLVWMLVQICLFVGIYVRIAAVVNYIFAVFLIGYGGKTYGYDWHVDGLIIIGSLFLIFMPAYDYFTVEYWRKRKRGERKVQPPSVSFIYTALLILVIGGIYLDSIFWKLTSPMYTSGLGFWAPASLPFNTYFDLSALLQFKWLNKVAGFIVLILETFFLVLIWDLRLRPWICALGIFFHIGILIAFPIPLFSFMMIAFYLGILPADYYAFLEKSVATTSIGVRSCSAKREEMHKIGRLLFATFISFWLFSFLLISFKSPFYNSYLLNDSPWLTKIKAAARQYKTWVYPWTGFSDHGVFMDFHFEDYHSQIMLIYEENSQKQVIPIISAAGTALNYNFNRQWVMWTFRAANPAYHADLRDKNIIHFVKFWADINDVDLSKGSVIIRARPVEVSLNKWQPDLYSENSETEWQDIGYLTVKHSELSIKWLIEPDAIDLEEPAD